MTPDQKLLLSLRGLKIIDASAAVKHGHTVTVELYLDDLSVIEIQSHIPPATGPSGLLSITKRTPPIQV